MNIKELQDMANQHIEDLPYKIINETEELIIKRAKNGYKDTYISFDWRLSKEQEKYLFDYFKNKGYDVKYQSWDYNVNFGLDISWREKVVDNESTKLGFLGRVIEKILSYF